MLYHMYVTTTTTTKESTLRLIQFNIFSSVLKKVPWQASTLQMSKCILLTIEINWQALAVGGTRAVVLNPGWTIGLPGGAFKAICI